tara:strand:+ start:3949 stop:5535 length:1587 start_codon:yes stop_codon:yes gene_type:complete
MINSDLTEGLNPLKDITMESIENETNLKLVGALARRATPENTSYNLLSPKERLEATSLLLTTQDTNIPSDSEIPLSDPRVPLPNIANNAFDDYTYQKNITVLPPIKEKEIDIVERASVYNSNYNSEKILEDLNPENNCQGEWGPWDESNCIDSTERCSIKSREYNVTKLKGERGLECSFEGRIVEDGDKDYDYCYGTGKMDRCGLDENACACNLDENLNASGCDFENKNCQCPTGYTLLDGKCSDGIQDPILGENITSSSSSSSSSSTPSSVSSSNISQDNNLSLDARMLLIGAAGLSAEATAKAAIESISASGLTPEIEQQFIDFEFGLISGFAETLDENNTQKTSQEEYRAALLNNDKISDTIKININNSAVNTCHINPFNMSFNNETEVNINNTMCQEINASSTESCDTICNKLNKPLCCMKPNELRYSKERYEFRQYFENLINRENNNGIQDNYNIEEESMFNSLKDRILESREGCFVNPYNPNNKSSVEEFKDINKNCLEEPLESCNVCSSLNTSEQCCKIPV